MTKWQQEQLDGLCAVLRCAEDDDLVETVTNIINQRDQLRTQLAQRDAVMGKKDAALERILDSFPPSELARMEVQHRGNVAGEISFGDVLACANARQLTPIPSIALADVLKAKTVEVLNHAVYLCQCNKLPFKNAGYLCAVEELEISFKAAIERVESGEDMQATSVVTTCPEKKGVGK